MELDHFIKDTLMAIYNGLRETNLAVAEKEGGTLGKDIAATFCLPAGSSEKEASIAIDVAVTVSKESQESGGGKVNVVIADLGAEIRGGSKEERVSRIKFHIKPHMFVG